MKLTKCIAAGGILAGAVIAGGLAAPTADAAPTPVAYYKNCQAARDAGVAPLKKGDDGYRPGLDRDGDGIACE
ncbi:excalibur calcium-binding domain-containing protein [Gordonia sp. ABSL49_1]|uniref:excalibur calcium-binding domain-containing protein n=1 Tax=unclassified Gordonia (in: high G+C Gram-positive bacteria) TaxID=2657482 RepID=UPI0027E27CD1|nr:excalibur calcium-binding domain-containing protein [Gordonia sp. ABSL49_1]